MKIGWKKFQMQYNEIDNTEGLEGYSEKDVVVVEKLLKKHNNTAAIPFFKKITLHVY